MSIKKIVISSAVFLVIAVASGMWGCPAYNVYVKQRSGEAKLREAEFSRRALVEEARAKKDSAAFQAEAEITRARGVAEANKIIGESLKDNDAYLRYLWVQGLNDGTSEVIYIPTEANLPILESPRLK